MGLILDYLQAEPGRKGALAKKIKKSLKNEAWRQAAIKELIECVTDDIPIDEDLLNLFFLLNVPDTVPIIVNLVANGRYVRITPPKRLANALTFFYGSLSDPSAAVVDGFKRWIENNRPGGRQQEEVFSYLIVNLLHFSNTALLSLLALYDALTNSEKIIAIYVFERWLPYMTKDCVLSIITTTVPSSRHIQTALGKLSPCEELWAKCLFYYPSLTPVIINLASQHGINEHEVARRLALLVINRREFIHEEDPALLVPLLARYKSIDEVNQALALISSQGRRAFIKSDGLTS